LGFNVKTFKDLILWQKSHLLTLEVYKLTSKFPDEEKFSLINQMRRAAYSIPSNIVEGYSRNSRKEFIRFLSISKGSLGELRYFSILAKDLEYISVIQYNSVEIKMEEVSKLIHAFIKSLKEKRDHN
jgi:four helix bundle protein